MFKTETMLVVIALDVLSVVILDFSCVSKRFFVVFGW